MEALLSLPALVLIALLGSGSVKVTSGGRSRLVERLGKYDRELQPGLSIVLPVVERVVSHESLKERVLDIPPQLCITRDNVSIEVDAVVTSSKESLCYQGVRLLVVKLLGDAARRVCCAVDFATEDLPRHPPHRRRPREVVAGRCA